jgi:hypothetical protein
VELWLTVADQEDEELPLAVLDQHAAQAEPLQPAVQ